MSDHQHNHHQSHDHGHDQNHHDHEPAKHYVDPVCGMSTDDADAFIPYEQDGKTYYFCSRHCLEKFKSKKEDGAAIKN